MTTLYWVLGVFVGGPFALGAVVLAGYAVFGVLRVLLAFWVGTIACFIPQRFVAQKAAMQRATEWLLGPPPVDNGHW